MSYLTDEENKIIDDSYNEICRKFEPVRKMTEDEINDYNSKDYKKYQNMTLEFGDIFLSQIILSKDGKYLMTYPQINVFIKYNICDQALVYEYVKKPRTWMYKQEYISNPRYDYKSSIYENMSKVDEHIDWYDMMYIFGHWKTLPNWKELRQAYERTFWYFKGKDFYRNCQIDRLL